MKRKVIKWCITVNVLIDIDICLMKMIGGTPEVRSDKSLTLLTFDIWHSTNGPMDQLSNGPIVQWTNEPMDQ